MKTVTGSFIDPQGNALANGLVRLKLSQVVNISGTALVAPTEVSINLNSSGQIPANTQIWCNDEVTPLGTTYQLTAFSGSIINGVQTQGGQVMSVNVSITGSSPIDLTTLTPTQQGVSLVVPISSVGLTMPAEFSVAGSPLLANGTLAVTKVNENANQVWAGPTTGVPAAPAFRALVDADIPGGLTASGTLKNKTLQGAASGNNVTLLTVQGAGGAITGNSAEQTVFSFAIPAGTIGSLKGIRVRIAYHHVGSASVTYKSYLNAAGSPFQTFSNVSSTNPDMLFYELMNTTAQTAQTIFAQSSIAGGFSSGAILTDTQNTANALTFKFTFTVANTDSVTPLFFMVELVQ